jgi:hypothetical protein
MIEGMNRASRPRLLLNAISEGSPIYRLSLPVPQPAKFGHKSHEGRQIQTLLFGKERRYALY